MEIPAQECSMDDYVFRPFVVLSDYTDGCNISYTKKLAELTGYRFCS